MQPPCRQKWDLADLFPSVEPRAEIQVKVIFGPTVDEEVTTISKVNTLSSETLKSGQVRLQHEQICEQYRKHSMFLSSFDNF